MAISQTVVEIWQFFKMAAAAILDFQNARILRIGRVKGAKGQMRHHAKFHVDVQIVEILTVGMVMRVKLRYRAKFCDRCGQTIAELWLFFDFFTMAAATMLDFYIFKFLTIRMVTRAKLRHRAKFHGDWSNCCGDMAIFRFFQDGGHPPSWILMRMLGPPVKKGIW